MNARRQWLRLGLGAGALGVLGLQAWRAEVGAGLHWHETSLTGFGTTLTLRVAHPQSRQARAACDAAVAEIREIESQMSLFRADSALCRLNRDGVLHDPPAGLVEVLRLATEVSQRSGGRFDVTVQPLWRLWADAARDGRLPPPQDLQALRKRVDWRALEVDRDRIRLREPGMAITLNGIAQGYAADRVQARLRGLGIDHALIDTGEWSLLGRAPQGTPWTLLLEAAGERVQPEGWSLAHSSDAMTTFSTDRVHHHILDPRTGDSPRHLAEVSVLAPSAALADALTKVFFMGDAAEALAQAEHWKVHTLVVDKQGRRRATPGLRFAPQA